MDYLKINLCNILNLANPRCYNRITKNIYIGDYKSSYNNKYFDVIINCTDSLPFYSKNTINRRFHIKDDLSFKSNIQFLKQIGSLLQFIHTYDQMNKKILVHCHVGMQRSAAVIASYLMKYHNLTCNQSKSYIKRQHPRAFFTGSNFNIALYTIEKNIDNLAHNQ